MREVFVYSLSGLAFFMLEVLFVSLVNEAIGISSLTRWAKSSPGNNWSFCQTGPLKWKISLYSKGRHVYQTKPTVALFSFWEARAAVNKYADIWEIHNEWEIPH
jgi:hypothetical protein